jgi:hypothetical protein
MKAKNRMRFLFWLLAIFVTTAGMGFSQEPPPPPPSPHGGGMGPGPMGGPMGDFGGGKVVKGIPLSADLVVIRETTLADGNRIHNESKSKIYRDAEGRVRRDLDINLAMPATGRIQNRLVVITDPVAGKRYVLNPDNKTARTGPMHAGPHGEGREDGEMKSPGGSADVTKESLGTKTVNGAQAEGVRVTRTIPAGAMGNEKPIIVVTERWYSPELQIAIMTVHTDPMMGTVTTKLMNVSQTVPDPALFQVPSDYSIRSGRSGDPMVVPMKP